MRWFDAFRVGITVVAASALLLVIYLATHGGFSVARRSRTIRVAFDNAMGIQERSEVTYHGVKVGEVQGIKLEQVGDHRQAVVTMQLDPKGLPARAQFRVVPSLLGFSQPHVEIIQDELKGQELAERPPGAAPLQGESPGGMEAVVPKAEQLVDNLKQLAGQMSELTTNLNRVAGDRQLQKNFFAISQNLAAGSRDLARFAQAGPQIARNLQTASGQLNALLTSLQITGAHFQATLTKMDQILAELQGTGAEFRGSAKEFHATAGELHQAAVENRQRLGTLMGGLDASVKTLNATLLQAQSLISDPQLRANLVQTADNMRAATDNLKLVTRDIQSLTGDPNLQNDLKVAITTLRKTTQEALTAFEQINRLLGGPGDTIQRLRQRGRLVDVTMEGLFDARHTRARASLDATVPWLNDSFWRVGLFDAGEANGLNLQFGQPLRYGDWGLRNTWLRLGAHASHLGLGLDWGSPQRPRISADLYNVNRPRLDLLGSYRLNPQIDAALGLDNIFRDPSPVLGLRYHYGR
jgi:ABC-type transporter Mla subunit MlaD